MDTAAKPASPCRHGSRNANSIRVVPVHRSSSEFQHRFRWFGDSGRIGVILHSTWPYNLMNIARISPKKSQISETTPRYFWTWCQTFVSSVFCHTTNLFYMLFLILMLSAECVFAALGTVRPGAICILPSSRPEYLRFQLFFHIFRSTLGVSSHCPRPHHFCPHLRSSTQLNASGVATSRVFGSGPLHGASHNRSPARITGGGRSMWPSRPRSFPPARSFFFGTGRFRQNPGLGAGDFPSPKKR